MRRTSLTSSDPLWAITCYFNPIGYRRRLLNYRAFRRRLTLPLVTVELSHTGQFALSPNDAEILIQRRSPDVLWHKERLLNIALGEVPRHCDAVAWLDCDIVFERDGWADEALRVLQEVPLLQPFVELRDLLPEETPGRPDCDAARTLPSSVAYRMATVGSISRNEVGLSRLHGGSLCGLAWVARRSVLEHSGLYDVCVLGSGVLAMGLAAFGMPELAVDFMQMNERQTAHYLAWARPFFDTVRGQVGYLEGSIAHLWHGSLQHRGYAERHAGFKKFEFDPLRDVAVDENGCWRWNSEKPEMHEYVKNYFQSRREDDAGPARAGAR